MRVRFRGITEREVALIDGPAGWGEFGAFLEYGPAEAAHLAGVCRRIGLRRTAARAAESYPDQRHGAGGARRAGAGRAGPVPGCPHRQGQGRRAGPTLADDVARVNAVRALVPTVRVDANGGWSVSQAVAAAARADRRRSAGVSGAAVRQCRRTRRTASSRRRADRRRREHPQGGRPAARRAVRRRRYRGAESCSAGRDFGSVRHRRADRHPGRGVERAGLRRRHLGADCPPPRGCPSLEHACGLGTGRLFVEDVAEPVVPVDGYLGRASSPPTRRG